MTSPFSHREISLIERYLSRETFFPNTVVERLVYDRENKRKIHLETVCTRGSAADKAYFLFAYTGKMRSCSNTSRSVISVIPMLMCSFSFCDGMHSILWGVLEQNPL